MLTNIDMMHIIKHIDKNRYEVMKLENIFRENAKIFKAFCDENRLMIIRMLQSGEKCACKILAELQIVQSTLSHHMKILIDSGIVSARKEGKWTYYSLSDEGVNNAKRILNDITTLRFEETSICKF